MTATGRVWLTRTLAVTQEAADEVAGKLFSDIIRRTGLPIRIDHCPGGHVDPGMKEHCAFHIQYNLPPEAEVTDASQEREAAQVHGR